MNCGARIWSQARTVTQIPQNSLCELSGWAGDLDERKGLTQNLSAPSLHSRPNPEDDIYVSKDRSADKMQDQLRVNSLLSQILSHQETQTMRVLVAHGHWPREERSHGYPQLLKTTLEMSGTHLSQSLMGADQLQKANTEPPLYLPNTQPRSKGFLPLCFV